MSQTPLGARKDGSWYAICTEPSITKTPIGPVQVPVPYQVLIDLSQATATASTVQLNGKPAFLLDQSKMRRCMGDEQGTSGGTRSGTTSMEVKPVSGGSSVQINGKHPVRHGDPCTLNKENCRGKFFASGTSMAPDEATAPKKVRVHILPRNPIAIMGRVVPLDVISSPKGGILHWKIKGDAKLIDRSWHSCREGSQIFIQGDPLSTKPYIEVKVTVTYQHPNGIATNQKTIFVPPSANVSEGAPTLQELAAQSDENTQWKSGGFRVMGAGSDVQMGTKKEKRDITVVCFIDGTGNQMSNDSNIFLMYDGIRKHKGKWPHDAIVDGGYLAGPGAGKIDYPGALLGTGSRKIAERAYRSISEQCAEFLEDEGTLPQIDIYGFSRGSAIANEVAWFISDRGIRDADDRTVVAPRGASIRFLGLFDTVHSMDQPGRDTSTQWHNTTIAPVVQHCAHALAADEDRVFFMPSFVKRIKGTGEEVQALIFPGVHSDVGGFETFNRDLMKLTRSWMSEQATKAGVIYLRQHIITEAEKNAILSDPVRCKPSKPGQAWMKENPLNLEEKRREAANRFWGTGSGGSPPGIAELVMDEAILRSPLAPVLIPAKETLTHQPLKGHIKRVFPKDIPRLVPEVE